jgi:hypothetical protein
LVSVSWRWYKQLPFYKAIRNDSELSSIVRYGNFATAALLNHLLHVSQYGPCTVDITTLNKDEYQGPM